MEIGALPGNYLYGRSIGGHSDFRRNNLLAQASYEFDFAKKLPRVGWLGFHRLSTLHTRTDRDELTYRFNRQIDHNIPGVIALGSTNAARQVHQLWDIGDAVQVGDKGLQLTGLSRADRCRRRAVTFRKNSARRQNHCPTASR